jgi:sugar lactone lactonase YvrE
MKRLVLGVGLGLFAYLLAWPVGVAPVSWTPDPARPLEGELAPNELLATLETIKVGPRFHGPEDVAVDAEGRIYTGVEEGAILRWFTNGNGPEVFAQTDGRPLGLDFSEDGRLWVADAERGLLSIETSGAVREVVTDASGLTVRFADDVEVAPDGIVWFTDASSRFDFEDWKLDVLESGPNGRLIRFDPRRGDAQVALSGLHFANGVAVAHDNSFVLVVETTRYRVRRYWISGPDAGRDEVWLDGLPGFPDGISRGEDGLFWLTLASPRKALVDSTAGQPWARQLIARLPRALWPSPAHYNLVIGVRSDGTIARTLQDPQARHLAITTSVQQAGPYLYLGTLDGEAFGRFTLP